MIKPTRQQRDQQLRHLSETDPQWLRQEFERTDNFATCRSRRPTQSLDRMVRAILEREYPAAEMLDH